MNNDDQGWIHDGVVGDCNPTFCGVGLQKFQALTKWYEGQELSEELHICSLGFDFFIHFASAIFSRF